MPANAVKLTATFLPFLSEITFMKIQMSDLNKPRITLEGSLCFESYSSTHSLELGKPVNKP